MMEGEKIKIMIVDDHPYIREGLVSKLKDHPNFLIVPTAEDGRDLISKYIKYGPDVCLVDIYMQEINGPKALEDILEKDRSAKVLFMTDNIGEVEVRRIVKAGGKGLICKTRTHYEIISAIEEVMHGCTYFDSRIDPEMLKEIINEKKTDKKNKDASFSDMDMKVLEMIGNGCTVKQISGVLCRAESTIEYYKTKLINKLGFKNIYQLISYASRLNIHKVSLLTAID